MGRELWVVEYRTRSHARAVGESGWTAATGSGYGWEGAAKGQCTRLTNIYAPRLEHRVVRYVPAEESTDG